MKDTHLYTHKIYSVFFGNHHQIVTDISELGLIAKEEKILMQILHAQPVISRVSLGPALTIHYSIEYKNPPINKLLEN